MKIIAGLLLIVLICGTAKAESEIKVTPLVEQYNSWEITVTVPRLSETFASVDSIVVHSVLDIQTTFSYTANFNTVTTYGWADWSVALVLPPASQDTLSTAITTLRESCGSLAQYRSCTSVDAETLVLREKIAPNNWGMFVGEGEAEVQISCDIDVTRYLAPRGYGGSSSHHSITNGSIAVEYYFSSPIEGERYEWSRVKALYR